MADFVEVLQNRDKKWARKAWKALDISHIYFDGGTIKSSYKDNRWGGIAFITDPTDIVADDWEEYKEPEQIKVWVGNGCMEFYLAKEPWDGEDTEATPEQLLQIRKALGIV